MASGGIGGVLLRALGLTVDNTGAIVKIRQTGDELKKLPKQAKEAATGMSREFDAIAKAAKTLGVAMSAGMVLNKIIKETSDAAFVMAQLEAGLVSTGNAAERSAQQLSELATSMSRTTIFDDEAVANAEKLLLTFTRVKGQTFDQAIRSAADLATKLGKDLPATAQMLGRALSDPEKGIAKLQKAGVAFSQSQVEVIKKMAETGDLAGAQAAILKQLEISYGGSAAAARNTFGGALAFMKNQFNNLFEATQEGTGGAISAFNTLGQAFIDLKPATDLILEALSTMVGILGKAVEGWQNLFGVFKAATEYIEKKLPWLAMTPEQIIERVKGGMGQSRGYGASWEDQRPAAAAVMTPEQRAREAAEAKAKAQEVANKAKAEAEKKDQAYIARLLETRDILKEAAGITITYGDALTKLTGAYGALDARISQGNLTLAKRTELNREQVAILDEMIKPGLQTTGGAPTIRGGYMAIEPKPEVYTKPKEQAQELSDTLAVIWDETIRNMQRSFASGFQAIFKDGVSGFKSFAISITDIFSAAGANILAAMTSNLLGLDDVMADLKAKMDKGEKIDWMHGVGKGGFQRLGMGAIAGGVAGYQSGSALTGGLTGAMTGFAMGGPVGALVGGVAGVVGGLFGASQKAKEAARQMKAATAEWSTHIVSATQAITGGVSHVFIQARDSIEDQLNALAKAKGKKGGFDLTGATAEGIDKMLASMSRLDPEMKKIIAYWEALKEQMRETNARMVEDLDVREATAKGMSAEADTLRRAAEQRRELYDAEHAGLDAATISRIRYIQGLENEAVAAAEAAQAAEKAAAAAEARAGFEAGLGEREAALRGDTLGATRIRKERENAKEIAEAQKLLDAGTITQEMFGRLAEVLSGELAQALADVEKAAADAAAASAKAAKQAGEDLEVRALLATGREAEANAMRDQLGREREVEEARTAGMSDDYINRLLEVQRLERERAANEAAAASAAVERAQTTKEIESDALKGTVRSVTGVSEARAIQLVDIARSSNTYLAQIAAAVTGGGARWPGMDNNRMVSAGPSFVFYAPIIGGSPQQLAALFADALDERFGNNVISERILSGDATAW